VPLVPELPFRGATFRAAFLAVLLRAFRAIFLTDFFVDFFRDFFFATFLRDAVRRALRAAVFFDADLAICAPRVVADDNQWIKNICAMFKLSIRKARRTLAPFCATELTRSSGASVNQAFDGGRDRD
jgi:hypothetical protein